MPTTKRADARDDHSPIEPADPPSPDAKTKAAAEAETERMAKSAFGFNRDAMLPLTTLHVGPRVPTPRDRKHKRKAHPHYKLRVRATAARAAACVAITLALSRSFVAQLGCGSDEELIRSCLNICNASVCRDQ